MATSSTYYLNAPSLASATAVFTNADMSTCAPNGFYSDGIIVREQVDCVLLPQQTCTSCAFPCPATGVTWVGRGIFIVDVDAGSGTGAIEITFNPFSDPIGIIVEYNGMSYTSLSSENFGYLASAATALPVYIGNTAFNCGLVPASPHLNIPVYRWDGTTTFNSTAFTENVTVISPQLQLTINDPGDCKMVIPKTSATPTDVRVYIIALCTTLSSFTLDVACPASLTDFDSSQGSGSSNTACSSAVNQTYYVSHVNGSEGELGLYDLVFADANGTTPLPDGFYQAPTASPGSNSWFRVVNGVIVQFGPCAYGGNYILGNCAAIGDVQTVIASYAGPTIPIGTICSISESDCCWEVLAYTGSTATETITLTSPGDVCADCCASYRLTNNTLSIQSVDYNDCVGAPQSLDINPGDSANICALVGSIVYPNLDIVLLQCGSICL